MAVLPLLGTDDGGREVEDKSDLARRQAARLASVVFR
jgi:hypothetical protein